MIGDWTRLWGGTNETGLEWRENGQRGTMQRRERAGRSRGEGKGSTFSRCDFSFTARDNPDLV